MSETEAEPTRKPPRLASYIEQRAMEDAMLANSSLHLTENGVREWHTDWSFARIAGMVSPDLSAGHAARVAKLIGLTFVTAVPSASDQDRLDALNARLNALVKIVHDLQGRIKKLTDELYEDTNHDDTDSNSAERLADRP